MEDIPAIKTLVEWYKATFQARTGTNNPYDALPDYRVPMSEILVKMRELGLPNDPVDGRLVWDEIFQSKLRRWYNQRKRKSNEC